MSALTLREQIRVARAVGAAMELEAADLDRLAEEMDGARQAEIELASELDHLARRVERLRRRLGQLTLLSISFGVIFLVLLAGLHA